MYINYFIWILLLHSVNCLLITFCICVYVCYQWIILVLLSWLYQKAQNFSFILGPKKFRTGAGPLGLCVARTTCPTRAEKWSTHLGKVAEGEERDAMLDLLLKHPNENLCKIRLKIVETFAIYIWNTYKNTWKRLKKPLQNICNNQIKHMQHMYETHATFR